MSYLKILFLLTTLFVFNELKAQLHCGQVDIVPNTSINQLLVFDDFSDYIGGITINSAAKIRVQVQDKLIVDPLCSWHLTLQIFNGAAPVTDWEKLVGYGSGLATDPPISLLQFRVTNNCGTPVNNGNWQSLPNNFNILNIITPVILPVLPGTIIPAGSPCPTEVNGPGSYLANYDQYNFNIDIRVVPNFNFNPGIYELNLRFHLEENSP